ncbi:hypothetical protein ACVWXO_000657 [Bradyrhizobium sp. LM2.7]
MSKTSMTLPIQKLAIRPQKMSGCCLISWVTGYDALNHQRTQDQSHDGVPGNAKAHSRDEVALYRRMRRCLRTGDAFDYAGAKLLWRFRNLFLSRVGDKGSDRWSRSGNERAKAPDDGAAQHRGHRAAELIARWAQIAQADVRIARVHLGVLVHALHELGDTK